MKGDPDFNSALEGRLPKALEARLARPRPGEPDPACLDEDTLAAWADHALNARERAAVEAHAADCARCQALLAAMVKTAQPAETKAAWWRTSTVKWLAPLTAAAAALLVWTLVPARRGVDLHDRAAVTAAGAPSREVLPSPAARQTPTPQSPGPQTAVPQSGVAQNAMRQSTVPHSTVSQSTVPQGTVASKSASPPPNELDRRASRDRNAEPPRLEEKKETDALRGRVEAADKPIAESAKVAPQDAAQAAPPAAGARAAAESFARVRLDAATAEIISTNPMMRWRIIRGGAVERSTDGGATWQLQQTGAGATLAAGASPSPSVCWMAGPAGMVLLQTDGSTWRRIAFPERVNLVSIRAIDERQATVTTADGRSFETHDGGLTWTRSPGP